jgi:hypothetical protein
MASERPALAHDVPEGRIHRRHSMDDRTTTAVPAGRVIHVKPAGLGIERIGTDQGNCQTVAKRRRTRRLDDATRYRRIRYRLAMADKARVRDYAHQQHLLGAVCLLLNAPQAQVQGFDGGYPRRTHTDPPLHLGTRSRR